MPLKLAAIFFLSLPLLTSAQALEFQPLLELSGINAGTGFGNYVESLYFLSIGIAALLTVIKITIAGVKWMLSDIVTDKAQAKKDIWGSLLGIIIIISGVLILTVINPSLVNVNIELDNIPETTAVQFQPNNSLPTNNLAPNEVATILGKSLFPNPSAVTPEYLRSVCEGTVPDLCNQIPSIKAACSNGTWSSLNDERGYCTIKTAAKSFTNVSSPGNSNQSAGAVENYTPSSSLAADSFFESGGSLAGLPPTPGRVTAREGWNYSGSSEYRLGSALHGKPIDWARPSETEGQGRGRILIGLDNTVLTQPFRTSSNLDLAGAINIAEAAGYEPVNRRMWISETPSGPSIDDVRCDQSGNSSRKISWSQSENRFRCVLKTDTNYFLNIQQTSGCGTGEDCPFYRTMSTNASTINDLGATSLNLE